MIFEKNKILVWFDDPPEDRVISIFAGCLANHDRVDSPSVSHRIQSEVGGSGCDNQWTCVHV